MPNDCEMDSPAKPALRLSLDIIANKAAKIVIKFPSISSLNASHL